MRKMLSKLVGTECRHIQSVAVTSVGVRRRVCRTCGHISFEMTPQGANTRRVEDPRLDKVAGL